MTFLVFVFYHKLQLSSFAQIIIPHTEQILQQSLSVKLMLFNFGVSYTL